MKFAKNEDEAQYFANVENMDLAVGQILKTLNELKLDKNTLIIFTSDNGPETLNRYGKGSSRSYGSPGVLRGMKLHIYEGGIRVPGIVRLPGSIPLGLVSDVPISSVDFLPTFCKIAGAKLPEGRTLDGIDLSALLRGEELTRTTPLFWHYYRSLSEPCVAMRDGDWKIVARWDAPHAYKQKGVTYWNVSKEVVQIIKTAKLDQFELYNLANDISEKTDLSKKNPKQFARMKALLLTKYAEVQKESPVWNPEKLDAWLDAKQKAKEAKRKQRLKQRKKK